MELLANEVRNATEDGRTLICTQPVSGDFTALNSADVFQRLGSALVLGGSTSSDGRGPGAESDVEMIGDDAEVGSESQVPDKCAKKDRYKSLFPHCLV